MTQASRKIVVTGAGGFIGSRLAKRLIADAEWANAELVLADTQLEGFNGVPNVRTVQGDLRDKAVRDDILGGPSVDILFHLAGILGGAAEADYASSRVVNVDATLDLLEALRSEAAPPRVVFASSIAVFGPPLPARIDDDTHPLPTMVYGAQKRMIEIVLEQFSARGWIDGLAVRLPGIVARPGADARLKSAFLNRLFYAYRNGESICLPVSPEGTTWLISAEACVDAFLHAAKLAPERIGRRRAFTLPAQRLSIAELIAALAARYPENQTSVTFDPDPAIEAQFTAQPPLDTKIADDLGFRHDGSVETLVRRVYGGLGD